MSRISPGKGRWEEEQPREKDGNRKHKFSQKRALKSWQNKTYLKHFCLCVVIYYNNIYDYNIVPFLGGAEPSAEGLESSQVQNVCGRAGRAGPAPVPMAGTGTARSWPGAFPSLGSDGQGRAALPEASAVPSSLEKPHSSGCSGHIPAEPICPRVQDGAAVNAALDRLCLLQWISLESLARH